MNHKAGRPTKEEKVRREVQREGQQPEVCTCAVQRATVGEDHARACLLYRRRGSGISVLNGPREQGRTGWVAASEGERRP